MAVLAGALLAAPASLVAQSELHLGFNSEGFIDIFRGNTNLTNPTSSDPSDYEPGDVDSFSQSNDGECIVFTIYVPGKDDREIWVMDKEGKNKRRVSTSGVDSWGAVFSSDGQTIKFTRDNPNGARTWTMKKDGTDAMARSSFNGFDFTNIRTRPRREPDEGDDDEISEERERGEDLRPESVRTQSTGRVNIAIWDATHQGHFRLLPGFAFDNYDGAWSPDGSKVSFTVRDGNQTSVGVINEDSTGLKMLTDGTMDSNTSWLDNDTIVFESTRDGNSEIYSIDINGQNETRVTNNPAEDTNPVGPALGSNRAYSRRTA